jgi:hypothetical protein
VHDLRTTALEVMQLLAEFHPYLTGGALDGTAGRYSAVEIDLYADSSKDVEIALLSHGISYETMDNRRAGVDAQLRLDWNDYPVLISVYPPVAERQQPKSPHGGRGRQRVRAEAVIELLRETRNESPPPLGSHCWRHSVCRVGGYRLGTIGDRTEKMAAPVTAPGLSVFELTLTDLNGKRRTSPNGAARC